MPGATGVRLLSPGVVSDPEIRGGEPVFDGTRVPVRVLLDLRAAGASEAELLADYPALDPRAFQVAAFFLAGRRHIAVDLDGTLAVYERWQGAGHIGAPIAPMVARVQRWLRDGHTVTVFTARLSVPQDALTAEAAILAWTETHVGTALQSTAVKSIAFDEVWDDRAVAVEANTGRQCSPSRRGLGD